MGKTLMILLVLLPLALHTAASRCVSNHPYHQGSSEHVLTCSKYEGNGRWYRDSVMINITNSNKYSITNYGRRDEKLNIGNPSIDDEDSYSCYDKSDATDVYCEFAPTVTNIYNTVHLK